eukprot:gb/GEZN01001134.1/.p1 GENE.gb/GEZN01001134.1/~~gb/GEZN01001134.1/.p1  ORF type:complete len:989 (-),score=180.57 gb/GEZN01001134.1/:324-3155(-)
MKLPGDTSDVPMQSLLKRPEEDILERQTAELEDPSAVQQEATGQQLQHHLRPKARSKRPASKKQDFTGLHSPIGPRIDDWQESAQTQQETHAQQAQQQQKQEERKQRHAKRDVRGGRVAGLAQRFPATRPMSSFFRSRPDSVKQQNTSHSLRKIQQDPNTIQPHTNNTNSSSKVESQEQQGQSASSSSPPPLPPHRTRSPPPNSSISLAVPTRSADSLVGSAENSLRSVASLVSSKSKPSIFSPSTVIAAGPTIFSPATALAGTPASSLVAAELSASSRPQLKLKHVTQTPQRRIQSVQQQQPQTLLRSSVPLPVECAAPLAASPKHEIAKPKSTLVQQEKQDIESQQHQQKEQKERQGEKEQEEDVQEAGPEELDTTLDAWIPQSRTPHRRKKKHTAHETPVIPASTVSEASYLAHGVDVSPLFASDLLARPVANSPFHVRGAVSTDDLEEQPEQIEGPHETESVAAELKKHFALETVEGLRQLEPPAQEKQRSIQRVQRQQQQERPASALQGAKCLHVPRKEGQRSNRKVQWQQQEQESSSSPGEMPGLLFYGSENPALPMHGTQTLDVSMPHLTGLDGMEQSRVGQQPTSLTQLNISAAQVEAAQRQQGAQAKRTNRNDDRFPVIVSIFSLANIMGLAVELAYNNWSFAETSENPCLGPHYKILLDLGAKIGPNATGGTQEWYRLLIAPFLSAGFVHVFFCISVLMTFGLALERVVGPLLITFTGLVAALVGTASSLLFLPDFLSVSSSVTVFGLLGAYWADLGFHGRVHKTIRGQRQAFCFSLVAVCGGLMMGLLPLIDNLAHLAGFFTGFSLGFFFMGGPKKEKVLSEPPQVPAHKRRVTYTASEEMMQRKNELKEMAQKAWERQRHKQIRKISRLLCAFVLDVALVALILGLMQSGQDLTWCDGGSQEGREDSFGCQFITCLETPVWTCDPTLLSGV